MLFCNPLPNHNKTQQFEYLEFTAYDFPTYNMQIILYLWMYVSLESLVYAYLNDNDDGSPMACFNISSGQ